MGTWNRSPRGRRWCLHTGSECASGQCERGSRRLSRAPGHLSVPTAGRLGTCGTAAPTPMDGRGRMAPCRTGTFPARPPRARRGWPRCRWGTPAARRSGSAGGWAARPAETVLTEIQQRTAEQLFRTLGELKGGAMKFGQALSVLEAALPEELAGALPRAADQAAGLRAADADPDRPRPAREGPRRRTGRTSWSGSTAARPRRRRSARCTRAAGTTAARSRSRCSTPAPARR